MRDVNVGEIETWNESERLGEKKKKKRVERERGKKKGESERETYERIQGMRIFFFFFKKKGG
jgi:hypothetical protein